MSEYFFALSGGSSRGYYVLFSKAVFLLPWKLAESLKFPDKMVKALLGHMPNATSRDEREDVSAGHGQRARISSSLSRPKYADHNRKAARLLLGVFSYDPDPDTSAQVT